MTKRAAGEGSLYKRADGKWVGVVTLGWSGGVLKRRKVIAATQGEALARLNELRKRIQDERKPEPVLAQAVDTANMTVGDWLEKWLSTEAAPSVRPRTLATYTSMTRKHLIPALGHLKLRELEPLHVRAYMNAKAPKLSNRTVQQHHAILRRALHIAESYGYVQRNAARLVTPAPVRRPEIVPMTAAECQQFLKAVQGDRLEYAYQVAMATGLRQSEMLGLRWRDIDFDAKTLRVAKTLQRYGHAYHLDEPKTDKSKRSLALAAPVLEAFKAQRQQQREERLRAGPLWQGKEWDLVFSMPDGAPMYGHRLTRDFQTALVRAEIRRLRFHDLRHGAATFLLSAGVELVVVQRMLGHSTIHTTANVYAHVLPNLQRDAADKLGAAVFGT